MALLSRNKHLIPLWMQNAGLVLLIAGIIFGFLGTLTYSAKSTFADALPFERLRPLHVSLVVFFILLTATGTVFRFLKMHNAAPLRKLNMLSWLVLLLLVTIAAIIACYLSGTFGGREYWEFPPVLGIPLMTVWFGLLYVFFKNIADLKNQPVYVWMWVTGFAFLAFTFTESYLWTIPWFRTNIVNDMTVQWKSYGSMVGSWNMMIYGSGIYLMDQISGNTKQSSSKLTFSLYFLGLFNLMFNWGHHLYTLPTHSLVHHIGYVVSMTELLLLGRIIMKWRESIKEIQEYRHIGAYRFMITANLWIFLNLGLAILMSVPAINVFTHGTHITVAHAMGTTIGINTMMLFAFIQYFISAREKNINEDKVLSKTHLIVNLSLAAFWVSLLGAGLVRSNWQMSDEQVSFGDMMMQSKPFFIAFSLSGAILMVSLVVIAFRLLSKNYKQSLTASNINYHENSASEHHRHHSGSRLPDSIGIQ